jgi:hypothetical protein
MISPSGFSQEVLVPKNSRDFRISQLELTPKNGPFGAKNLNLELVGEQ